MQRRIRGFRATGETRHVPKSPESWKLSLRYSVQKKTEKSADLAPYFSGVAKFYLQKSQTSNVRGPMSGLDLIFTGEIPPVNFKGQNPGGESFSTFRSGGYAHGCVRRRLRCRAIEASWAELFLRVAPSRHGGRGLFHTQGATSRLRLLSPSRVRSTY